MIPPLGGQTGEELGLGAGALERWDHQTVVRRRPKVAGGGVRPDITKGRVRKQNTCTVAQSSSWISCPYLRHQEYSTK